MQQGDLFGTAPALPEGFRYQEDLLTESSQADLVTQIRALPFAAFQFHGYEGNRRVVYYGWRYDFNNERLDKDDAIPPFLLDLRDIVADFAGMPTSHLQQALVTEYDVGAGIGWHRDKAVFGEVIGVSLVSPCTFRLRRKRGEKWERVSVIAKPGSAYLLSGPSRSEWEHSIPPVQSLRYSVTYRNLRDES